MGMILHLEPNDGESFKKSKEIYSLWKSNKKQKAKTNTSSLGPQIKENFKFSTRINAPREKLQWSLVSSPIIKMDLEPKNAVKHILITAELELSSHFVVVHKICLTEKLLSCSKFYIHKVIYTRGLMPNLSLDFGLCNQRKLSSQQQLRKVQNIFYLPTPPLGQDMTHGQFLSGV